MAEGKNKGSAAGKVGAAVVGAAVGAAAGVAAMVLTDPKKKKAAVGLDKLSKGAVNLQKRINQELKAVKGK
ncbi:MAG: hypothetical protein UY33_C0026G0013 [Candidatus Amesbacteria bacterium GW2011_GWA1_48_9]|uniref:Uncharacterized protein n=1 Tax=Candidatus Amesbacteria bacterium GW2011_GWA1_48_9 TaxID=1618355 RepID=A0A0G1XZC7_9BACT|nr:MAG: hypothetical protein UY33_C0026G0013 [Candidatus Amesbacteria bacterium GW2011_GWA1_48_9]